MPLIRQICDAEQVDSNLVAAIILTESSGQTYITRYEPTFHYLEDARFWASKLNVTELTEIAGQKTSWGLMQVMGGTARSEGFEGYFPELCQPEIGIKVGATHLKGLIYKWDSLEEAVSAYNAGTPNVVGGQFKNEAYVQKVMSFFEAIKSNSEVSK